ncbi:MAG TPA: hemerythrin domain-containing protein [Solirubrobacteraceae bacterium]|nr:hemerythrin domain-containing protein [Solirubrobacteraceae bacterium]
MKRSAALASLSRDHHQALVVAQRLRRADAAGAADARERFLDYWREHGRRHFRLEEEVLLPGYAAHGDAHDPLVLRVLGEHVEIRHRADRIAARPVSGADDLHDLGERLAAHVRLEERELFPLIERAMPADELLALARALERAEDEPPPSA